MQKEQAPFPSSSLETLKAIVTKVVDEAAWTEDIKAHERQWGKILSDLILGLELLPYGEQFRFMNMYGSPPGSSRLGPWLIGTAAKIVLSIPEKSVHVFPGTCLLLRTSAFPIELAASAIKIPRQ